MKTIIRKTFFAAVFLSIGSTASAAIAWDENVDGDLSEDAGAPTPVALGVGDNTIIGSAQATGGDTRDYITFTIGAGQALAGIMMDQYQDLSTGGEGNTGFAAINLGATSLIPDAGNSDFFLGGSHLNQSIVPLGTDLLAVLATAPQSGTGFTAPLGAGTYSFLFQQTGPELTGYTFNFQVAAIPVPAAVWLFGSSVLALLGWRRRPLTAF